MAKGMTVRENLLGGVWRGQVVRAAVAICLILMAVAVQSKPFQIRVVDGSTSRGIPLVILESSLNTRHVTDSNGIVAFEESGVMGRQIHFRPKSDGYSFESPGLAMGGVTLTAKEGSSATIVMEREMIAERLYRITGAGIYKDSAAVGEAVPIEEPLLNAGVIGQDSTLCAMYKGKVFWVWGDTSHLRHPLAANFRATAATSDLPSSGGLPIERGVNLQYFSAGDFVKPMVNLRPGDNSAVYWLSCLMNVPDKEGQERLVAWYNRVDSSMNTLERGIVEFNPEAKEFRQVAEWPTTATLQPGGHAVKVDSGENSFMVFTNYGEQTRVRAMYEAAIDPGQYEALTCLEGGGEFTTSSAKVAREHGKVVYRWIQRAAPVGAAQQKELAEAGLLKAEECIYRPVDAKTGKPFQPHSSSMAFNARRGKWIMLTSELGGTSMLGELWYLEADQPEGPWGNAVKVLTHEQYSFYNPLQHPEMVPVTAGAGDEAGRYLYFEGTYTKTFSGATVATPWYDYNQVMYRLDLDDRRLEMEESVFQGKIAE